MGQVWEVAGLKAAPGNHAQGMVQLPGVDTEIPLFLLNSWAEGPTTVILGGVHGCEYTSIDAAIQLLNIFKDLEVRGRLAVAPVVSMAAYSARSLYVHPVDRKNLNRLFPGREDGSESERLACQISRTLITPCDYLIDLHGGDMCESLVPHIYYYLTPDTALNERARRFARHFGMPYVYGSRAVNSAYQSAAIAGKISVLVEAGQQGVLDPAVAAMLVDGCLNALRFAGVLPGETQEPTGLTEIQKYYWVESDLFGAWYPQVQVGDMVQAGQKVGEIRDLFGNRLKEWHAEAAGRILFCLTSLAINPGDALYGLVY